MLGGAPIDPGRQAGPARVSAGEERKVVSVVFADLEASTQLATRLDPEDLREVYASYFEEMAAQIEQSRAFYRQVAHLIDLGVRCAKEASMVKLEATEMSVRVTNQAMQLHGGNGYTTERQVERHWRDARLTTIFEGTSEIQKRIISDRLLPRSPLA